MEIKDYHYGGGHGPIENQKAIEDQFYARHQLRNALVELDRKTRSEFNALTQRSVVWEQLASLRKTDSKVAEKKGVVTMSYEAAAKRVRALRTLKLLESHPTRSDLCCSKAGQSA